MRTKASTEAQFVCRPFQVELETGKYYLFIQIWRQNTHRSKAEPSKNRGKAGKRRANCAITSQCQHIAAQSRSLPLGGSRRPRKWRPPGFRRQVSSPARRLAAWQASNCARRFIMFRVIELIPIYWIRGSELPVASAKLPASNFELRALGPQSSKFEGSQRADLS